MPIKQPIQIVAEKQPCNVYGIDQLPDHFFNNHYFLIQPPAKSCPAFLTREAFDSGTFKIKAIVGIANGNEYSFSNIYNGWSNWKDAIKTALEKKFTVMMYDNPVDFAEALYLATKEASN